MRRSDGQRPRTTAYPLRLPFVLVYRRVLTVAYLYHVDVRFCSSIDYLSIRMFNPTWVGDIAVVSSRGSNESFVYVAAWTVKTGHSRVVPFPKSHFLGSKSQISKCFTVGFETPGTREFCRVEWPCLDSEDVSRTPSQQCHHPTIPTLYTSKAWRQSIRWPRFEDVRTGSPISALGVTHGGCENF